MTASQRQTEKTDRDCHDVGQTEPNTQTDRQGARDRHGQTKHKGLTGRVMDRQSHTHIHTHTNTHTHMRARARTHTHTQSRHPAVDKQEWCKQKLGPQKM